jgi:hypothetical protein
MKTLCIATSTRHLSRLSVTNVALNNSLYVKSLQTAPQKPETCGNALTVNKYRYNGTNLQSCMNALTQNANLILQEAN